VIGHIVKVGTQDRDEIRKAAEKGNAINKLAAVFRYIFVLRISGFLTILAVGFGALLVLARESLPVTGWDQAIALGIGLAILTDEQLLAKIKPPSGG